MTTVKKYTNGNAIVTLHDDGTRYIEYPDHGLSLDFPLNVDIRVSNKCLFGLNPKTQKAVCSFCHESARVDGHECEYDALKEKIKELPKGVELAIGSNELTENLFNFIVWAHTSGYIINLTVNQGHIRRDSARLLQAINNKLIHGLGVSYRSGLASIPEDIITYKHTVVHVISGIDNIDEVVQLANSGVKKILILGEKDFGFNEGKVDLNSKAHLKWYQRIHTLFNLFEVVSFDNLAIEQLNIKRFFNHTNWDKFNQGEHSFYINAVDKTLAQSSRSAVKWKWDDMSLTKYFKMIEQNAE